MPDGARLYAVGDVHGRDDLLQRLLHAIAADAAESNAQKSIVFLGDYVDRGPQSKEVVERLIGLDLPDWRIVRLRGNHDQAVLDFIATPSFYRVWRNFGAADTLLSYGVKPPRFDDENAFIEARGEFVAKCPRAHLEFLNNLDYSYELGDYFFVHAGVRPGISLNRQSPEDMMWIRDDFLMSNQRFEKVVVHGHTPADGPVVRPNRIGVDTGAYATNRLTAAVLHGKERKFLSTGDGSPMR